MRNIKPDLERFRAFFRLNVLVGAAIRYRLYVLDAPNTPIIKWIVG